MFLLDTDGLIIRWSSTAERLGFARIGTLGRHFSCLFTEEDRARGVPAQIMDAVVRDGPHGCEGWRLGHDGRRFWSRAIMDRAYDDAGRLVGFSKLIEDLSARRALEQRLGSSTADLAAVGAVLGDVAIAMLDPGGYVTDWSPGAQALFGCPAPEAIGHHISAWDVPEERALARAPQALALAMRGGRHEAQVAQIRRDGSRFDGHLAVQPMYEVDGRLRGFVQIVRDVTAQNAARAEIGFARAALAQSQKLEVVGRLTGGVVHDFNNLLTIIRASADLLEIGDGPEEKRRDHVRTIAETADRAARHTRQLLAFTRRQPFRAERFDAGARIEALRSVISVAMGAAIDVVIRADPGEIEADANQFETAVLNLAVNARDAMPNGGKVAITARAVNHAPASAQDFDAVCPFLEITVSDQGEGIASDILPRILEPFFTTKPVGKGTGLGLGQVESFARSAGGRLAIESEIGRGTAVTMILPRITGAAPTRDRDETPARSALVQRDRFRLILVEDSPVVGRLSAELLRELGHEVAWVQSATEALGAIERSSAATDVVLTDVIMPGVDGVTLARTIRARWPDLPVILTTGLTANLPERDLGFPVLEKPYSAARLTDTLEELRRTRPERG